ncbi:Vacuole morphology and inheritance protein 14 [Meyerozyma sp. JA9]|nr:Vacuole morphology and inheritance protein 14 [Meyerozyma sp. JA9]
MSNALDPSIVKDLSNHIYEKRKATAFQIENLTKAALTKNDSQTIYSIIKELADLVRSGTNSAKMGAITALGSVSVALGSFAIAYFLDDIIKPIFATFRDTDARVRYYACESLYNIAKIARGEILVYFNQVFDILCILVTDTESSVKNAADILDRLIKDIVSAKSTNYVSIVQQEEFQNRRNEILSHVVDSNGVAIQVNIPQDAQKAFSLPKFIPTLLERMYIIDPFAKKFLLSWLELFDDIPSLELITYLPNFLEPLIKFLMNNAPSDVRIETQKLLTTFLKEIKAISNVRYEIKRKQLAKKEPKEQVTEEVDEAEKDLTSLSLKDSSDADGDIFLKGQDIFIDYPMIISILLSFLRDPTTSAKQDVKVNDLRGESRETYYEIQTISLKWLQEIIKFSPTSFVKFFPDCVNIITQNLAITNKPDDEDLRIEFLKFNSALQNVLMSLNEAENDADKISEENEPTHNSILGLNKEVHDEFHELYFHPMLDRIIKVCTNSSNELARITSLDWLIFLYSTNPTSFTGSVVGDGPQDFDFTILLRSANDASNEVVFKVLQFLSKISESNHEFFITFMTKLITFCEREMKNLSIEKFYVREAQGDSYSRERIEFVIRKLCVTLDSEKIYRTLSEVLYSQEYENLEFLNLMVLVLNNILLTSRELTVFRNKLKNLGLDDWNLFATLFKSWCHNPACALSLCLLTSQYELGFLIIKNLSESEVNLQLLTQLDVLVQLLESPIFLKLRLQLLEPESYPYLYKTLYGLLMILPQSSTFNTLRNRLATITNLTSLHLSTPDTVPAVPTPGSSTTTPLTNQLSLRRKRTYEMLDRFTKTQETHSIYKDASADVRSMSSSHTIPRWNQDSKDYFSSTPEKQERNSNPLSRLR